jgi:hypothetical protein
MIRPGALMVVFPAQEKHPDPWLSGVAGSHGWKMNAIKGKIF